MATISMALAKYCAECHSEMDLDECIACGGTGEIGNRAAGPLFECRACGGVGGVWLCPNALAHDSIHAAIERRTARIMRESVGASRGQGLVEYALIIALVAIVVIGSLVLLAPQINSIFTGISQGL